MRELTDTFLVEDIQGRRFTVHEYTDIIDPGMKAAHGATARDVKTLQTAEGHEVKHMGERLYEIVKLQILAYRV